MGEAGLFDLVESVEGEDRLEAGKRDRESQGRWGAGGDRFFCIPVRINRDSAHICLTPNHEGGVRTRNPAGARRSLVNYLCPNCHHAELLTVAGPDFSRRTGRGIAGAWKKEGGVCEGFTGFGEHEALRISERGKSTAKSDGAGVRGLEEPGFVPCRVPRR